MMTPSPASSSPCVNLPSSDTRRSASTNPKASINQSMAALPSSYAIIGIAKLNSSLLERSRFDGPIFAEDLSQHVAAFADGHIVGECGLEHRQQVVAAAGGPFDVRQVPVHHRLRPARSELFELSRLLLLLPGIEPGDLQLVGVVPGVLVHSDHHPAARLDALLESICALGDALLRPTRLDAPD